MLPSAAYAKGFLRTYAQLLGLDAEALVDEFRRQVEAESRQLDLPAGRARCSRRGGARGARPRRSRVWLLIAVGRGRGRRGAARDRPDGADDERRRAPAQQGGPSSATRGKGDVESRAAVPNGQRDPRALDPRRRSRSACWAPASQALIDGQVLSAGSQRGLTTPPLPACGSRPGSTRAVRARRWTARRHALNGGKGPVGLPIAPGAAPRGAARARRGLPVSVRAGIVVTGTEVITGADHRSQRPLDLPAARRARGRGRAHPHGRRPARGPRGRPPLHGGRGLDLIVTSGGLGPTADDLTAEVVARFAGREMVLDEEHGGARSPRSSPTSRAGSASTPTRCASRTASRRWCPRGADDRSIRPAPRPGSWCRSTAGRS